MSEMQLNAFKKQYGLKGCPVRFVTAYGPRENETHAIIALIYKALAKMDPYQIWGDGSQIRQRKTGARAKSQRNEFVVSKIPVW